MLTLTECKTARVQEYKCEGMGYSRGEQPSKCKNITVKGRGTVKGSSSLRSCYTCKLRAGLKRENIVGK